MIEVKSRLAVDQLLDSRSFASSSPITRSREPSATGKREWREFVMVSRMTSSESLTSSQTNSVRGVIIERSCRSPKRKMLATISRSASSKTPASAPSSSNNLISSSVTATSLISSPTPSKRRKNAVASESRRTTGRARFDSQLIGRATEAASRSGLRRASRLGTSSPMTTLKNVMVPTTIARAIPWLYGPMSGSGAINWASSFVSAAPPNAPARMPIKVMPTWTVDNRAVGSIDMRKAIAAPELPLSASVCSLSRREETMAYSASANTPLSRISITRMPISTKIRDIICTSGPDGTPAVWLPNGLVKRQTQVLST